MEDSPAISVSGVSKKYRLYGSVKERLKEALHPFNKQYHREFWALRDISFDVPKGQTLGIIGRNGSGKSTLLAIICSILRPTSGVVEVDGRISALLELGAGFNPQFTGRDNVVFNAQLMGLSAREIRDRLPEIEAFADIGEFIDQPVKIYSSGMFVRLAFAAAVNVDPDILIIDEALAVGDTKFQHKCYTKFCEFQEAGRTILFVTHDTNAVLRFCDHAILLENGSILIQGQPNDVVNIYTELMACGEVDTARKSNPTEGAPVEANDEPATAPAQAAKLEAFLQEAPSSDQCTKRRSYNPYEHRYGDQRAQIIDYMVVCDGQCDPVEVRTGTPFELYVKILYHVPIDNPILGFALKTVDGLLLYGNNTTFEKIRLVPIDASDILVFRFSFRLSLNEGQLFIDLGAAEGRENLGIDNMVLDRRYDLIHLAVRNDTQCAGFWCGAAIFEEVTRLAVKPVG